jgi:hypothetical protein
VRQAKLNKLDTSLAIDLYRPLPREAEFEKRQKNQTDFGGMIADD